MKITKEALEERLKNGESLRKIAASVGVKYQTLQYHRRRWNCPPLRKAHTSGKEHASWNGGEFIDRWGYKFIRAPYRDCANPYTHEHILVAEKTIGRRLKKGKEVVHHINGDKSDNRPENLLVCDRSRHRSLHRSLGEIGYILIKRGEIEFTESEYRLIK